MEVQDSLFMTIFVLVFMSFLALFAVLGNGLVLGITARFKNLRTFPNILIANLALADFFNAFINTPVYLLYAVLKVKWFTGKTLAIISLSLLSLFTFVNVVSMLALLVNMFLAIKFDLKYFTWKTNKKAFKIVLVEWLVGFICAVLLCLNCDVDLQKEASVSTYRREVSDKGKPIAPVIISAFVVIAVVLSAMIFGSIQKKKRQRKRLNLPQLQAETRLQQDIKAAKIIIIIIFAFLGCYIPPVCIRVWVRSNFYATDIAWHGHLIRASVLISSGINPVIYCFRARRFRCALRQLLNDPCGKTAFQEIRQEQRAREIIPNRNARGDSIAREPDQERFELTSCSPLFQWVRNSNCCNGRMGQIVQRFEQKKSSENMDEKLGRRAARKKVIPFTVQDKPQVQIVSPPSKSLDNENYTGKFLRKERPTPDADYSRQEVIVEVHPIHGPLREKVTETPTSKDDLATPIVIITE